LAALGRQILRGEERFLLQLEALPRQRISIQALGLCPLCKHPRDQDVLDHGTVAFGARVGKLAGRLRKALKGSSKIRFGDGGISEPYQDRIRWCVARRLAEREGALQGEETSDQVRRFHRCGGKERARPGAGEPWGTGSGQLLMFRNIGQFGPGQLEAPEPSRLVRRRFR